MPVAEEVSTLRIPSGVPVVTVTRQTYAGQRVVEVATDIVLRPTGSSWSSSPT